MSELSKDRLANVGDVGTSDKSELITDVERSIGEMSRGKLRAAWKSGKDWVVNEQVKRVILMYFRLSNHKLFRTGYIEEDGKEVTAFDKISLKTAGWREADFVEAGFRMVPGSLVREGAFVSSSAILMPCFINIGAYVGEGSMIDTWATVGSCAQVGANCHISGGAGIGGVLEPVSARPVIIEDDVFVGGRSEVAEGVVVHRGSVISMGVFLGASTPIVDRATGEVSYGEIPENSVVLPATRPGCMGCGDVVNMPCVVIAKKADKRTREKVRLNAGVRSTSSVADFE